MFVRPLGDGDRPGGRANSLALQPDGKIVFTGPTQGKQIAVARLNQDGTLDTSFGTEGRFLTDYGAGPNEFPLTQALVLQPDGRVVVGGYMANFATLRSRFLVARLSETGRDLDPSFGSDGKILTQLGEGTDPFSTLEELARQPDGKLVAAGLASGAVLVVRLNVDGSLDASFATAGKLIHQFGQGTSRGSRANALVLQPDGKILVGGEATDSNNPEADAVFLARLNPDGKSFDSAFGNDGEIVTRLGKTSRMRLNALALQPDGKIVIGGSAFDTQGRPEILVARLNADGSLDPSFGNGGTVISQLGEAVGANPFSEIKALAIQPNGKIVAAGNAMGLNAAPAVLLARLNADGTFDSSFATGEKLVTQLSARSFIDALALSPDGKLLAGGGVTNAFADTHALVARLVLDLPPSALFTASPNPAQAGQPVAFGDSGSTDPEGTSLSYAWDFGDGATAAGSSASHSYASPGAYTATLTVRDGYGLSATSAQTITVSPVASPPAPPAPLPPSPPQPPPAPPIRARTPVLTRLTITPPAFEVAPRVLSVRQRTGAVISYRDTVAATTTFAVARLLPGRKVGRRCAAETARNRAARRCTRFLRVRGSFSHRDKVGTNRVRFSGRLRGRALSPGPYRLTATPRANGRVGRSAAARFRILP